MGRLDAAGQGLGGIVRLAAAGRFQQLLVNLRANDSVIPSLANIRVGAAIVDARITLYDQPEVIADVQVAQTRYQSTDITALRAVINYRGERGFARLLAEGTSGVPFRVAINSDFHGSCQFDIACDFSHIFWGNVVIALGTATFK